MRNFLALIAAVPVCAAPAAAIAQQRVAAFPQTSVEYDARMRFHDGTVAVVRGDGGSLRIEFPARTIQEEPVTYLYRAGAPELLIFSHEADWGVIEAPSRIVYFLHPDWLDAADAQIFDHGDGLFSFATPVDEEADTNAAPSPGLLLNGSARFAPDGILLAAQYRGINMPEGQDDYRPFSIAYEITDLVRRPQDDALFEMPDDIENWTAPG